MKMVFTIFLIVVVSGFSAFANNGVFLKVNGQPFYKSQYKELKQMFARAKDDRVANKFKQLALYTYAVKTENIECPVNSESIISVKDMFRYRTCYVRHFTDGLTIDKMSDVLEAYCKINYKYFPNFNGDLKTLDGNVLMKVRKYILEKSLSKLQDEMLIPQLEKRYRVEYEK